MAAFPWVVAIFCFIHLASGQIDILQAFENVHSAHQQSLYLANEFSEQSEAFRNKFEHVSGVSDNVFASSYVSALENYSKWLGNKKNYAIPIGRNRFGNVSEVCLNHSIAILEALMDGEMWSINMLDALGKLPSGVLEGNILWMGGFSQCRNITATVHSQTNQDQASTESFTFKGQYCLASIGQANNGSFPPGITDPVVKIGVCVPDSCSSLDVLGLVNAALYALPEGIETLKVDCKSESLALDGPAYAVIALLSVLAAIIMCGTCYDVIIHRPRLARLSQRLPLKGMNEGAASGSDASSGETLPTGLTVGEYTPLLGSQRQAASGGEPTIASGAIEELGTVIRVILCFSAVTNAEKILTVGSGSAFNLQAVHGIRFLSMTWVILGHTLALGLSTTATSNILLTVSQVQGFAFQAILNATVSVDSFFLLSGTLISYLMLSEIKKREGPRNVNWFMVYFHRFWRLTPPYMLILAIYTTLFRYLGSGPMWVEHADHNCQNAWWANLLYINNFFSLLGNMSCLNWTWFLANDMQFFIISPIILVILYKTVVGGMVIIFLTIVGNIAVVSVVTYQNNYIPEFPGLIAHLDQISDWFDDIYLKPWCRIGSYSVGLLLGYALFRAGRNVRLHWLVVAGGWAAATACNLAVLYGLYNVANGHALTPGVSAFYASTHRIVWAAGLAWLIFACANGYGGPINSVLSWSALVPLSRLTYMAYLVHPIVMSWYYASQETVVATNNMNLTYLFLGHLVVSYGVAFVASVTLEAPMMALEKVLLPRN